MLYVLLHEDEEHAFLFLGYDSDDDYGDHHDRNHHEPQSLGSRWSKGKTYTRVPVTTADDDLMRALSAPSSLPNSRYSAGNNNNTVNSRGQPLTSAQQNPLPSQQSPRPQPPHTPGGKQTDSHNNNNPSLSTLSKPSLAPALSSRYKTRSAHAQNEPSSDSSPNSHNNTKTSGPQGLVVVDPSPCPPSPLASSPPSSPNSTGATTNDEPRPKRTLEELQNSEYRDINSEDEDDDDAPKPEPLAYINQKVPGQGTITSCCGGGISLVVVSASRKYLDHVLDLSFGQLFRTSSRPSEPTQGNCSRFLLAFIAGR